MQSFDEVNGWAGWQGMFLLEGLPAVATGLIVLGFLDDGIQQARWLDNSEKKLLAAKLAKDTSPQGKTSFTDAMRDGRVWFGCLLYLCIITGLYGVTFWLPTIISESGIKSPAHIGVLTAIPYSIAAIGMILVSGSSDRRGERRWHIAVPALLAAGGLTMSVLFKSNLVTSPAALLLATFGILTAAPLFLEPSYCLPTRRCSRSWHRRHQLLRPTSRASSVPTSSAGSKTPRDPLRPACS